MGLVAEKTEAHFNNDAWDIKPTIVFLKKFLKLDLIIF